MEIKNFVENFAAQFEMTDASELTANTKFKDLGEWSSLMALSIIAMVDEEYNVAIKGKDIRESETIEDLFNVVKERV